MSTITISLPESLKAFVEQEVATQGYGNVSEYFRTLLREAQDRNARQRLDARLLAGLEAGNGSADAAFWGELRLEAQRLIVGDSAGAPTSWPAIIVRHRAALETLCRAHAVQELALVGASARANSRAKELEFAVHLGAAAGAELAQAYAKFSKALSELLEGPIDLIEIGSMGPTRLRRLLEQTRRVLYPPARSA